MAARRVAAVPGPRGVVGPLSNARAARGLVAVRRGEPVARPDPCGNHPEDLDAVEQLISAQVQMGWVHSTLPKFVADQLRRGPTCHASLDVRKTIEELDLLRDLSTELRRRHAIDEDEAAAYAYVAEHEGGRLDPVSYTHLTLPTICSV